MPLDSHRGRQDVPFPYDADRNLTSTPFTPLGRRDAVDVAPGTWMRRREWRTPLGAAYAGLMAVCWAGIGIFCLVKFGGSGGSTAAMIGVELFFAVLAAISLRLAIRIPRAGVRIGHEGVTLRGMLRTRQLGLTEVDSFVPGVFSSGAARSSVGVRLKRQRGHDLIVWAMRSGASSGKASLEAALGEWQPVCDELNDLLHAMRGEAPPASGGGREPPTQEEADRAYRLVRLYLAGSALWFLVIAAVLYALDVSGWEVFLAGVAAVYGLAVPLILRSYRRELDRRVGQERQEP